MTAHARWTCSVVSTAAAAHCLPAQLAVRMHPRCTANAGAASCTDGPCIRLHSRHIRTHSLQNRTGAPSKACKAAAVSQAQSTKDGRISHDSHGGLDPGSVTHLRASTQGLRLPRHLAVIMDGNARWARHRGRPIAAGHEAGVEALRGLVLRCSALGIQALTVYAFSTDNWNRPGPEVAFLLKLFETALQTWLDELHTADVRVMFMGDRSRLPPSLVDWLERSECRTAANTGLWLNVALSYSAQDDVAAAAQRIASLAAQGLLEPAQVDAPLLQRYMSTAAVTQHAGPPELIVRSGGECRLSNFLLLEAAYTELYFSKVHWPDFGEAEFLKALHEFGGRERRFGQRK